MFEGQLSAESRSLIRTETIQGKRSPPVLTENLYSNSLKKNPNGFLNTAPTITLPGVTTVY